MIGYPRFLPTCCLCVKDVHVPCACSWIEGNEKELLSLVSDAVLKLSKFKQIVLYSCNSIVGTFCVLSISHEIGL